MKNFKRRDATRSSIKQGYENENSAQFQLKNSIIWKIPLPIYIELNNYKSE